MSTMEKKNVLVGVANQAEQSMKVEEIQDWEPKKVSYIGSTAYFQHDDTFYSMDITDFRGIYGHKLKK